LKKEGRSVHGRLEKLWEENLPPHRIKGLIELKEKATFQGYCRKRKVKGEHREGDDNRLDRLEEDGLKE